MAADHVAERNGPGRACRTWRTRTGVVSGPGRTRPCKGVAARPDVKRGQVMRSDLEWRTRPALPAPTVERHQFERERLLRAACNAGLEPNTVIRVAEALTGQPWARLGTPEIATVARELLSAAHRAVHQSDHGAHSCEIGRASCRERGRVTRGG